MGRQKQYIERSAAWRCGDAEPQPRDIELRNGLLMNCRNVIYSFKEEIMVKHVSKIVNGAALVESIPSMLNCILVSRPPGIVHPSRHEGGSHIFFSLTESMHPQSILMIQT